MTAPAQEQWTILAGIPNVVEDEEANRTIGAGADFSVVYEEIPSASVLTVRLRMSSPSSPYVYPYIAAADRSGLLLLRARRHLTPFQSKISYHICDARTGEVISLGKHWPRTVVSGSNVGLILKGERCMVAELLPKSDGSGSATLLCYTVGQYRWIEMELTYSPPLQGRSWFGEGVISHDGMLWWVDLSYGILACDPFADEPELRYVPLPGVLDELPAAETNNRGALLLLEGERRKTEVRADPQQPLRSGGQHVGAR